jgi:putative hydrolase of the HAD superfamily
VRAPSPTAILLDLDDTILQYDVIAKECWMAACQECLPPEWAHRVSDVLTEIWRYRAWFWSDSDRHRRGRFDLVAANKEIVQGALRSLDIDGQVGDDLAVFYARVRTERIAPFPGALDALSALRKTVPKLALITNGDAAGQRAKVERFGLAEYFDCICIEGEFGAGKPDPRIYDHVLEQLAAQPSEAWMVGDNLEWDVATPQRLGMFGIWVDVNGQGLPANSSVRPDRIVRGLADIVSEVLA